jgi:membrane-bound ClpP family serine protease
MQKRKLIGIISVIIGATILISSQTTLLEISLSPGETDNIGLVGGLVFIIVGIVLLFAKKYDKGSPSFAQRIIDKNKYIERPEEMKSVARDSGYILDKGAREGTNVLKGTEIITVIPGHKIKRGTSRGILEALASGESNFRKRTS